MSFAPSAGLRTQAGLQILAIDAPFGRCAADALDRITAAAETIGADEIRLSPTRGFVLLATAGALAATVLADLAADFIVASDDPRRRIDACTGAPGCASGSTPTLADAARLAEVFRPLAMAGSSAHVSGCAKGCARPGPADVTLVGREGVYGAVIGGAPSDEPTINLPIEAVLERLGRAESVGLAAAFAPETARSECGGTRRPA
jgi:precorrin-3B synthase